MHCVIFGQNRAALLQFNTPDATFIFTEVYKTGLVLHVFLEQNIDQVSRGMFCCTSASVWDRFFLITDSILDICMKHLCTWRDLKCMF